MKIVVLDGRPLALDRSAWAGLDRLGELVLHDYSTAEEIPVRAAGAAVLVTNKSPIREELIAGSPELRFITVTATGFDCVDLAAARRRGIAVANVPEYGTLSVAQYVFALLLELCHHAALHGDAVRAGEWTRQPDFSLRKTPLCELAGKTMGIAGYGRIGRRVGELAQAFGMHVLACDPVAHPAAAAAVGVDSVAWCDLDTLFASSDVISLHCPLTEQTAGLVNRQRLRLSRPGAFLINTARRARRRGGPGRSPEFRQAGGGRRGRGRAEPIEPDNPLLGAKNCLITPHIAWATAEARGRLMDATVANVSAFLAGQPINVVN